jgi:hypothetical protein
MEELRRPVVWIDADAEVVKKPSFSFDCDLGVRIYDFHPPHHPSRFFTGTIYLKSNPQTFGFVNALANLSQNMIEEGKFITDQQVFDSLIYKMDVRLLGLPEGYCAVFDEKGAGERFIVHYQASRLYKKIVEDEVSIGFLEQLSAEELRKLRPRME